MKPKLLSGVLFVVCIVAACAPAAFFSPTQTATPSQTSTPVLISREEAIQHAIEACNPGYGLQPVEQPTEFETEITTYKKALGFAPIPSKAERPVWVVKMKGKWLLVGGPAPAPSDPSQPTPEPDYWDECTQIIDAQTGEWLSIPIG